MLEGVCLLRTNPIATLDRYTCRGDQHYLRLSSAAFSTWHQTCTYFWRCQTAPIIMQLAFACSLERGYAKRLHQACVMPQYHVCMGMMSIPKHGLVQKKLKLVDSQIVCSYKSTHLHIHDGVHVRRPILCAWREVSPMYALCKSSVRHFSELMADNEFNWNSIYQDFKTGLE